MLSQFFVSMTGNRFRFILDLSRYRFMVLQPGEVGWDRLVIELHDIEFRRDKKFTGTLHDCFGKMPLRGKHRFFHLNMPFGTLLMDGGLIMPNLERLARQYSQTNHCTAIWLQGYDHFYCQFPEITAWKNGEVIRHNAPGLIEKWESYLERGFVGKESFEELANRKKTLGDPLPCEQNPDTLAILAALGWTEEVLMRPEWNMTVTSFG